MPGDGLDGRSAFVTGGASGIGLAIVTRLAEEGCAVVLGDRDREGGESAAEKLRADGADVAFEFCDVAVAGSVERAVDAVVSRHGRIDLAANNAGVASVGAAIDELSDEAWQRTIDVNLTGVWRSLRAELRHMRVAGRGSIVNTASICGFQVAPLTSPYNTTKHGVIGLTKEAALDFAALGVRVNAVCPGYTHTAMSHGTTDESIRASMAGTVPMARWAEPVEIADAVVWLLSDRASYVTGHALVVDGGTTQAIAGPRD